jgi:hypothetical protein
MESEKRYVKNIEKPSVVYHASNARDIERFEARSEKIRDVAEGPRIFAAVDKRLASIFMVNTDDSWANSGISNGVPYIVISDRERFISLDQGGAIYTLPSDSFSTDLQKGLGEAEWTSNQPVSPLAKEEHSSALEAMLGYGVQVYFVDPDTYQSIRQAPDHGLSILHSLTSENQKRNLNIESI